MSKEKRRVEMDYSTMSDFLKCNLRGWYRHHLHIVPLTPSLPLVFGGAIHEAMASWYRHGDKGKAIEEFASYWNLYAKEWEKENSQEGIFSSDFEDSKRNLENGVKILDSYFKLYSKEPFEIISNEFPFKIDIGTDEERVFQLTGKIDLVVKWGDLVLVMDHKTTSALGPQFFRQFEPSLQMDGYTLAGREIFGKCDGVLINAILVAKTKQTFERDIFVKTEEDLDLYKQEVLEHMHRVDQVKQGGKPPARNTDACMLYGGCPYLEICQAKGDERVIRTRYKTEVWSPFNG